MRLPARLLLALLLALPALAAPQRHVNLVANSGFEALADGQASAWQPYVKGFALDETGHSGRRAARCVSTRTDEIRGLQQDIVFDPPVQHPIKFSGWSKAQGVAGGGDYCLWLDCHYADGTPLWGQKALFSAGTHDWEYAETTFTPAQPLARIQYIVLFRRCQGEVWFDDFSVSLAPFEVQSEQLLPSVYGGNSLDYAARLSIPAQWEASILRGGQPVFTQPGQGAGIAVSWDGRDVAGKLLAGGAYTLRVAAKDDLLGETLKIEKRATTKSGPGAGYVAWTDTAMERTLINRLPRPDRKLAASMSLARNERESCQIALRTSGQAMLRDCRVSFTDLRGPGGKLLAKANLRWDLVGFVDMPMLSLGATLPEDAVPGWWPDPLLPVSRFTVPPATTQAVWLTAYAPPGTAAGVYKGTVTLTPANAPALPVPLQVTVYDFDLPTQGHLKTAFALMDGFLEKLYGQPLTPELRRKYGDFVLQHRLNPDDISRTDPPDLDDLAYYDDRGLNAFNVINMVKPRSRAIWVCWSPLEVYTPTFKQELIARLDPVVAELKRRGLDKKAYVYTFDERGEDFYPVMKEYFGLIKERYGIPTLTTAQVPQDPQVMQDLNVDWNCPLTPGYHMEQADRCRAAGQQVWAYVCCGPGKPYANFLADFALVEARLIWWQAYQQKMDGFLYWGLNIWGRANNDYLIDPERDGPRLRWSITTGGNEEWLKALHGDGELLYAGQDGPLGCIRLANIRDGLDDYEYLWLLGQLTGSADEARAACAPVATDLTAFSRDPRVLLGQRERIARRLEALQRRGQP
jgi:hypothetical protein